MPLPALLLLISIVGGRYLQDLFHDQIAILEDVFFPLLKRGQSTEDSIEQLRIDAYLVDSCGLDPFLVSLSESFADSLQEVVVEVVSAVIEGLLGVVGAEEEISLQIADWSLWVFRFVDVHV